MLSRKLVVYLKHNLVNENKVFVVLLFYIFFN